ncbi:hypothetical protein B0H13DRAFT_1859250 [Mycena leptocephala]|nr:hypothetical protein B0H13DRAFT_1859250 [Mycena leptocephala]
MTEAFPAEIWRTSWNHASSRDLKTLSSSCTLFRDLCQPLLFHTLSYVGPFFEEIAPANPKKTVERMERSRDRLLSIASSARIPPMIRRWSFHCPTGMRAVDTARMIGQFPAMKRVLDLSRIINTEFSSTIGVYINLSELTITGFRFSPDFCQTLASLPKLTMMHLTDCDVVCPASSSGGIPLEEFICSYEQLEWEDDIPECYNLVATSRLKQLEIVDPVPGRAFLTVFAASGPLPRLVRLNLCLGHESKDVFYRFLDCCPELKCIELEVPPTFGGVTLPETSIPVLCSFTGPVEIAGIFAGGRPVRSFKFHRWSGQHDEPVDTAVVLQTLLQISSSSATIEELYLPFISLDSNPLRFIAENFPKLKRLLFFLQDTRTIPSEDGEEVEDDWETVDGPSETDSDDEIIDVDEDDEHDSMNSTGWMPFNEFRKLLNMSGQDLEEMMFKPQDGDEPLLDDYDDNGSECSDTSASVDWPEDEVAVSQKVYEDLKPDSFEDFMLALANDSIPLPRNIRVLCIGQLPMQIPRARNEKSMPDADISAVVEKLGARYPGLNKKFEVVVGFQPRAWKRKGGDWKQPKPEQPMSSHPLHRLIGSLQ